MATSPFNLSEIEQALNGRFALANAVRGGGQGFVYRARRLWDVNSTPCNRDVALKLHLDARQDARVEREIQAAKDLKHPALATLLEEGLIFVGGRQTRYIAWDFIEGEPLDSKLLRGSLNERDTVQIATDVAAAISVLWSKRIVHRDIAPKNIMVKPDGHAVLIDLGGARHLDNSTLTATGFFFGTIGYLSPEQFRAERALTCASDVFALGIVLFECLLGSHPTARDQHVLVTSPPSAVVRLPNCDRSFSATIDKMLMARASFRPSLAQLTDDLKRAEMSLRLGDKR
jgi:serine/threonine protein kinase